MSCMYSVYVLKHVFCFCVSCLLLPCLTSSVTVCHVLYCHCVTFNLCHCVSHTLSLYHVLSHCVTHGYSVNVSCLLSLSHPLSLCLMSCHPETCWEQPKQAAARPSPSSSQQSNCSTSYPSCHAMVGGALNAGWGLECWMEL